MRYRIHIEASMMNLQIPLKRYYESRKERKKKIRYRIHTEASMMNLQIPLKRYYESIDTM